MTTSIVAVLLGALAPALGAAMSRANYAEWQLYSTNLRADPDMLAYYTFEQDTGNSRLLNVAAGDPMDGKYAPEKWDGQIENHNWTDQGRFAGKPAMVFDSSVYDEGVVVPGQMNTRPVEEFSIVTWIKVDQRPRHHLGYIAGQWYYNIDEDIDDPDEGLDDEGEDDGDDDDDDGAYDPEVLYRSWSLVLKNDKIKWRVSSDGSDEPISDPDSGMSALSGAGRRGLSSCETSMEDYYGQWVHVATTMGDGQMKLYLNGDLVDSSRCTGMFQSGYPITIAGGNDGTAYRFDGAMDELALLRRKLTDDEVREHYNAGKP